MRRRFEDNAETRRFLFGIQRELGEKKFPAHSATVLLHVSAEPGERAPYNNVADACGISGRQVAHAVQALVDAKLLERKHEDADARRTHLVLTKEGRSAIGALIMNAQSLE